MFFSPAQRLTYLSFCLFRLNLLWLSTFPHPRISSSSRSWWLSLPVRPESGEMRSKESPKTPMLLMRSVKDTRRRRRRRRRRRPFAFNDDYFQRSSCTSRHVVTWLSYDLTMTRTTDTPHSERHTGRRGVRSSWVLLFPHDHHHHLMAI